MGEISDKNRDLIRNTLESALESLADSTTDWDSLKDKLEMVDELIPQHKMLARSVHANAAAHHFDQLMRNCQPQAGSAKSTRRGRVGLPKGVENMGLLLTPDTDSRILHRNF